MLDNPSLAISSRSGATTRFRDPWCAACCSGRDARSAARALLDLDLDLDRDRDPNPDPDPDPDLILIRAPTVTPTPTILLLNRRVRL